jgi:hypothetical protein
MTEEKPLTREDVLKLIEEHGGPEGLDLSGKEFEFEIDLSDLDLHGINFSETAFGGANFQRADLRGANLGGAELLDVASGPNDTVQTNLQEAILIDCDLQQANLCDANLRGACLQSANLEGANFRYARLGGAELASSRISSSTELQAVDWGPNLILGEEKQGHFYAAEMVYRALKLWHSTAGLYSIAGGFFFREMEARRKCINRAHFLIAGFLKKFLSPKLLCMR